MNKSFNNIDALIFDMDGTLWNATDSYAKIWNLTCKSFGYEIEITGEQLSPFMGMSLDDIMRHLFGNDFNVPEEDFLRELESCENRIMPSLGGVVYPGVIEGLRLLKDNFRLFMLSNCSSNGLINFTSFTRTTSLFEGLLSQGERYASKSDNLSYLKNKYSLAHPIYIGDTQADCDHAHSSGLLFAFATYGFGTCHDPDFSFDSFNELTNILLGVGSADNS